MERDASVSLDKIADVKRSTGDQAGALAAYEESLAIARRLAGLDPGNVSWQTDLVVSLYKIAIMADGERKRTALDEAIKIVERLDAEGKLSPAQKGWKDGCWRCGGERSGFVTPLTERPDALWQLGS